MSAALAGTITFAKPVTTSVGAWPGARERAELDVDRDSTAGADHERFLDPLCVVEQAPHPSQVPALGDVGSPARKLYWLYVNSAVGSAVMLSGTMSWRPRSAGAG